MIPDFIPAGSNSPFAEGEFKDWIPSKDVVVPETTKPKSNAVPVKSLKKEDLTDEDLRDLGIDPIKYRIEQTRKEEEALSKLGDQI